MKVVKPNLIDISTDGQFKRSSVATYFNSSGIIVTAAIDEPRFGYDPTTLEYIGLIKEKAATNLVIGNTGGILVGIGWTEINCDINLSWFGSGPNMRFSNKFVETATNSQHYIEQNVIGLVEDEYYTCSTLVKVGARNFVGIRFGTSGGIFNLSNLTCDTQVGLIGYKIQQLTGLTGWYRISITAKANNTSESLKLQTYTSAGDIAQSYVGNTTITACEFTYVQAEVGLVATSLIDTDAGPITRSSDLVYGTFTDSSSINGVTSYDKDGKLVKVVGPITNPVETYDPVSLEYQGILKSEAISVYNLGTYTEDFRNTADAGATRPWEYATSTSIANSSVISPTGSSETVSKIKATAVDSGHKCVFQTNASVLDRTEYTVSIYAKAVEVTMFKITTMNRNSSIRSATFDLVNGTVFTKSSSTVVAGIQKLQNGWCRCWMVFSSGSGPNTGSGGSSIYTYFGLCNNACGDTIPTVADGLFVYGYQLELGNNMTNYIPRVSNTVEYRGPSGLVSNNLIYTTATNSYSDWLVGTTYAVEALVSYKGNCYRSLQPSNTGKNPETEGAWWQYIGGDNKHGQFDNEGSSISSATNELTFVFKPGKTIDTVVLMNVEALITEVVITDSLTGDYVNRIYSNFNSGDITDWYEYFTEEVAITESQIVFEDIPVYNDPIITVRLRTYPSGVASLSQCVCGTSTELGLTQYGANAGIVDYSVKQTDEFGNYTFVKRGFSKRLSCEVLVEKANVNKVQKFLYTIRATPVVWIGTAFDEYTEPMTVFGFYKDFSTVISYPSYSMCSLEIEGLT